MPWWDADDESTRVPRGWVPKDLSKWANRTPEANLHAADDCSQTKSSTGD